MKNSTNQRSGAAMNHNKLKPCPFCGHTAEVIKLSQYGFGYMYFVACRGCGAEMPRTSRTPDKAAERWNKRTDTP